MRGFLRTRARWICTVGLTAVQQRALKSVYGGGFEVHRDGKVTGSDSPGGPR